MILVDRLTGARVAPLRMDLAELVLPGDRLPRFFSEAASAADMSASPVIARVPVQDAEAAAHAMTADQFDQSAACFLLSGDLPIALAIWDESDGECGFHFVRGPWFQGLLAALDAADRDLAGDEEYEMGLLEILVPRVLGLFFRAVDGSPVGRRILIYPIAPCLSLLKAGQQYPLDAFLAIVAASYGGKISG
jgi:hypothetical protein